MNKKILNSEQSKLAAKMAIEQVATPVKQTLGPGGNPIVIQRTGQNPDGTPVGPIITKDGVTVAEHVQFRDPATNTFAQTIIEVAQNTVKKGGDGTTTSIVLAEAIFNAGYAHIEQGKNSIELYQDLKSISDEIVDRIDEMKKPISNEDVMDVARISSNGDEEIANVVYEALMAVGEDGYVSLEDGYAKDTFLDVVDGAFYFQGWRDFGPYGSLMVNDEARNLCELSDPAVLMYAGKLDSMQDFEAFLGKIWEMKDQGGTPVFTNVIPLMIIANDYSDDIKDKILTIRKQAGFPIAAIKAPQDGSPNSRTRMLEDLAIMLGGEVGSKAILPLKDITDDHLGCCNRIEIRAKETVIYGGQGDTKKIDARIKDLKKYVDEAAESDFDKENVRLRIGKLSGGVAIVRVGGLSKVEIKEKKDRIEDALSASKAAILDGIVTGGGYTLYELSKHLADDTAGKIMKEALQAPMKQIIRNAGKNPDVILSHMVEGMGYDARAKEYVPLMEAGIVDPAIVTKSALQNAVSIAGLLLTTGGALISDIDAEDGNPNPLAAMMGM